jgi:sugar lactone lactonase YvrE
MLATSPDLNDQVQLADGKVDRRGRFIVGSSDRGMKEARGKLYALDPGATALRIRSIPTSSWRTGRAGRPTIAPSITPTASAS